MTVVMPPAPVDAIAPAPVRLNHVSSVNCVEPSGEETPGAPSVTPSSTPSSSSALFAPGAEAITGSNAGAPAPHVAPPTRVPVTFPAPAVFAAEAPFPSSNIHRPWNPAVPAATDVVIVERICARVRSSFQMRTSSTCPAKNPSATLSELYAVPTATGWIESCLGTWVVAEARPVEDAVEIQTELRTAEGRGRVMPDVHRDRPSCR